MYTRANGFMGFAHASLVNGGYCLQLSSTPSSLGDQCLNWKKIQIIPNISTVLLNNNHIIQITYLILLFW